MNSQFFLSEEHHISHFTDWYKKRFSKNLFFQSKKVSLLEIFFRIKSKQFSSINISVSIERRFLSKPAFQSKKNFLQKKLRFHLFAWNIIRNFFSIFDTESLFSFTIFSIIFHSSMNFQHTVEPISNFFICDTFSEKKNVSAVRWIKKLKWELRESVINEIIFSKELLNIIEFFFIDDVADWAKINYDVISILTNPSFDQNAVSYFKNLFQERFFIKSSKINQINFDSELQNFKQKNDESLLVYYKRILLMMQKIEVKDKSIFNSGILLSSLERVMLDFIIRVFIRGLLDDQMRLNLIKMLTFSERFLRGVYILTKKSRRTKKKFQKFKNEQIKQKKLNFLRDVMQRNMISTQIQTLKTFYHSKDFFYFFKSDNHSDVINVHTFHIDMRYFQPESIYQHQFSAASSSQMNVSYPASFGFYQFMANQYQSVNYYQPESNFYQPYQAYQQPYSEPSQAFSEFNQQSYSEINQQKNPYIFSIISYQSEPLSKSDPVQSWHGFDQNRKKNQIKNKQFETIKKIYSFLNIDELFDKFEFKNLYVNEIKIWKYEMKPFCIFCGELDHIAKNCQSDKLKTWESFISEFWFMKIERLILWQSNLKNQILLNQSF